jgi:hypothetical protein
MADGFQTLPDDSQNGGKKIDCEVLTVGGLSVYRQRTESPETDALLAQLLALQPALQGGALPVVIVSGGGGGGGSGDASAANQLLQLAQEAAIANGVVANGALLGAVTETAPASDTASSGLNGRLQRIAQRLTAMISQLPASLGIKTAAASLSVAPASDAVFATAPAPSVLANRSGTITTGGTSQLLMAANPTRRGYSIQNLSTGDLGFNGLGVQATLNQPSIRLAPGALYETPAGGGGTDAVSIIGATAGQAFSAREW